MKYVLGLSFEFKYYKNPANIKIFSNNQLIDDIDLTEDINSKNYHLLHYAKTYLNIMTGIIHGGSLSKKKNLGCIPNIKKYQKKCLFIL